LLAGAVFAETTTVNFAKNTNYVKPHLPAQARGRKALKSVMTVGNQLRKDVRKKI
jgi:hypothetical protein